jgi:ASC-1-like (ASCH) protein
MSKEPEKRPHEQSEIPEFTLRRQYIELIKSGKKTTEGRINSGGFKHLIEGDKVKFFDGKEPEINVLCEILGIGKYASFSEMLTKEGFQTMIPDARSLDEAVGIYNRIPTYPERARKNGVLALRLKVVNPEGSENKE